MTMVEGLHLFAVGDRVSRLERGGVRRLGVVTRLDMYGVNVLVRWSPANVELWVGATQVDREPSPM